MKKIQCKKMLFSSDGTKYGHPNKETVAKLIKHNGPGLEFYFNYKTDCDKDWDNEEMKRYHAYTTFYPDENEKEISISL